MRNPFNNEPQRRPPGDRLKKLAAKNRLVGSILTHTHVLQIVDDHQYMWFEASTDEERREIHRRFRVQLMWSMGSFVGLELSVHGAVLTLADPLRGGSLVLLGLGLVYIISLKGS